jgi:hypothetical protein
MPRPSSPVALLSLQPSSPLASNMASAQVSFTLLGAASQYSKYLEPAISTSTILVRSGIRVYADRMGLNRTSRYAFGSLGDDVLANSAW